MDRRKVVEEKSGKVVHGHIVNVLHWKIQKPEGNQKIFHYGSNGISYLFWTVTLFIV